MFCTEEQLADECFRMNDLIMSIYRDFGFEQVLVKLATRPEKRVGSDSLWDHAEKAMSGVLEEIAEDSGGKIKTGVNPGEGTFYGPKFEYVLRDAIGRDWQCGTIQVDFNLPERFGAFYIDADGEKKTPVMIHRAMFGSMERFTGILLESTAGHLPLWLAPVQVEVCTIVSDADAYAEEVLLGSDRPDCARRSICETRRSTTRCASTRWPRCRCCLWWVSVRPRRRYLYAGSEPAAGGHPACAGGGPVGRGRGAARPAAHQSRSHAAE